MATTLGRKNLFLFMNSSFIKEEGGWMSDTVERVEDRLADFTRDKRVLLLSLMALRLSG